MLLAVTLFASPAGFSAKSAAESYAAVIEMISDPLGLLSKRSPGVRGAALIQTKQMYANDDYWGMVPEDGLLPGNGNRDSGISNVIDADFTVPPTVDALPSDDLLSEDLPVEDLLGLYESPDAASFPDFFGDGQMPSFYDGGWDFAGAGPGSAPGNPAPLILPPSEIPVPEPEIWFMMIMGFFAVGSVLRLKNGKRTRIGQE